MRLPTRGTIGGHGGIDTTCRAGSGTTQHPVPLLVGWAQHTLIHPSGGIGVLRRSGSHSEYFSTPCAQPALISAILSLKGPEAALEAVDPQDLHQARPVVLVITVTAVTKIQRCPLEPTP